MSWALLLSVAAVVAMFRFKVGMIPTLAACSAAGSSSTLRERSHDGLGRSAYSSLAGPLVTPAIGVAQSITFAEAEIGKPPKDFEPALTGKEAGRWEVVEDKTATVARRWRSSMRTGLTTASRSQSSCRPCRPTSRFRSGSSRFPGKSIRPGASPSALIDRNNYYVVRANALEDNVSFYRVVAGKREQIRRRQDDRSRRTNGTHCP